MNVFHDPWQEIHIAAGRVPRRRWRFGAAAALLVAAVAPAVVAEPLKFTNYTIANGLGSDYVSGVYADGNKVYVATYVGLSVSTDGGKTYTSYGAANGLPWRGGIGDVLAVGNTLYVSTYFDGVGISTDGGSSWTFATMANGLGSHDVRKLFASGSTLYAATHNDSNGRGGLSVSSDGGATWTNYSSKDGLAQDGVWSVHAAGDTVYASGYEAVSVSLDGCRTWTNYGTANGLPSTRNVLDVYAVGDSVYAATFQGGLCISTDNGVSWRNVTRADGLSSNTVLGITESAGSIYAAMSYNATEDVGGVNVSSDGGLSWVNYTTTDGLGNAVVRDITVNGGKVYAATDGGLSIAYLSISAVPEIDPAGMGSVIALVTGALGLVERRRLKIA